MPTILFRAGSCRTTCGMEELECTVQKHVENFCKLLPIHVERWRTLLEEAKKPSMALSNYAEQLRYVEKANIEYIEDFKELQEKLRFKNFSEMEEEITLLKNVMDGLNQANQELKNKLSILERSTIDLNWESDTQLLVGSAFQPPLSKILQTGQIFFSYFCNAMKSIKSNFKNIDVRDEKSMTSFEKSFELNLEHHCVSRLLCVTQYVNNKKAVI